MKGWGGALFGLGLLLLLIAWLMPVTVSVAETRYSTLLSEMVPTGASNEVVNLQKLQVQMMVWHAGLIAFLTGCVLGAAGAIAEKLGAGGTSVAQFPESGPAGEAAGSVVRPAGAADIPSPGPMSDGDKYVAYGIGGLILVVMLIVVSFQYGSGNKNAAQEAALSNAEAIADNLEMTADNLEAISNMTLENARP